jgi:hypothetical protein
MRKALFLLLPLLACDKKDPEAERGAAPPPIQSSAPGACAAGGGKLGDPVSAAFFPGTSAGYCVDPNGEVRAYGEKASGTVDQVCTELFDGECETYKSYGLKRVVTLRYIDGRGSPASVNVNLSRFADKEGAYGFFVKRVIGSDDPTQSTSVPLEAGAAGALGSGIAYVWRGDHVAELSYTNELESPEQLKQSSRAVLPVLAKEIGEKLPGDQAPLPPVAALPEAQRIPLGVWFDTKDALGVKGAGPGAVGYYKEGDKRWRVLALIRPDEESAKDVLKTLKQADGARSIKGAAHDPLAFTLSEEGGPRVEWVVARAGNKLFGIGDEEHVLEADQTAEEASKLRLDEGQKLERLGKLVAP